MFFTQELISTLIYYTQQDTPAKVIGHVIMTLFSSCLLSLLGTFILKKIKKSERTFFHYFSFIFLLLVIVFSIGKNAGIYMANKKVNKFVNTIEERQSISQPKAYYNSDYGVSFKYPLNWEQKTPQQAATLILLYERNGSEASCNLSVVEQDMPSISDYDTKYFQTSLTKILTGITNLTCQEELINGKTMSITNYDFIIPQEGGDVIISSLTITALHKGKRFMLVINTPKDKLEKIKNDKKIIYESILFE